jgi:hypothetical protein
MVQLFHKNVILPKYWMDSQPIYNFYGSLGLIATSDPIGNTIQRDLWKCAIY